MGTSKTLNKEELRIIRKKYGSKVANLINHYLKVTNYIQTRDNGMVRK